MSDTPVIIERTYNAPISTLWKALTDLNDLKKWYFDLEEFKAEVGFEFRFLAGDDKKQFEHACRVTQVVPEKKIAYTWRYPGYQGDSEVSFELFNEGEKTRLVITHEGLDSFPKEPEFAKKNFEGGWTYFTGSLAKFLGEVDS